MTQPDPIEYPSCHSEQGFTLIEILVAVLILSLGILGLIGMESLALKSNLSAYHRSQATILAYDLADKMRGNPAGVGEYITAFSPVVSHTCISYSGAASACSPQKIAENDIYEWTTKVAEILPSGAGSLAVASGIHTVTISWRNDRYGEDYGPADHSFAFSFGL